MTSGCLGGGGGGGVTLEMCTIPIRVFLLVDYICTKFCPLSYYCRHCLPHGYRYLSWAQYLQWVTHATAVYPPYISTLLAAHPSPSPVVAWEHLPEVDHFKFHPKGDMGRLGC